MARYYPAIIEPASEGYGVYFPDVPGCTSAGATVQEAARNAEEALQAHLDLTAEHGEIIPAPSELDAIVAEPGVVEAARVLVRAEVARTFGPRQHHATGGVAGGDGPLCGTEWLHAVRIIGAGGARADAARS